MLDQAGQRTENEPGAFLRGLRRHTTVITIGRLAVFLGVFTIRARKHVDATYYGTTIPLTHTRKFTADPGGERPDDVAEAHEAEDAIQAAIETLPQRLKELKVDAVISGMGC